MDEQAKVAAQQLLQTWIQERQKVLLEQVMLTWEEGLPRLNPDPALMDRLGDLMTPPPAPEPVELQPDLDRELSAGLDLIAACGSQGEVLKRLLEAIQTFGERSAIFVVKQGIATLYASRGFESDQPKPGAAVVPPPELEPLLKGTPPLVLRNGPSYQALLTPLSRFEASDARVLALRLRQKVVALALVDSGLRQVIDHPGHVRALCHAAEAALAALAVTRDEEKPVAPKGVPAPAPAPAQETAPPHARMTQLIPDPIHITDPGTLDPKLKQNAERSARVLVGDVELYFPQKVEQGRKSGNLYGLLKDELDRSRASFIERYGADVESQHRIFYRTVVQQLCSGDAKLLGAVPWPERNQGDN